MLNVGILSVVMLSVVMMSVIILNVVAPNFRLRFLVLVVEKKDFVFEPKFKTIANQYSILEKLFTVTIYECS
jgi:hypothetical protein